MTVSMRAIGVWVRRVDRGNGCISALGVAQDDIPVDFILLKFWCIGSYDVELIYMQFLKYSKQGSIDGMNSALTAMQ
jgi:hypothetical protein